MTIQAKDLGVLLIGIASCIGAFSYVNKPAARFELVQLGAVRADQFLLDKANGRIWQSVCVGDADGIVCKGRQFWDEMFVSTITPQDSPATSDFKSFVNNNEKKSKK